MLLLALLFLQSVITIMASAVRVEILAPLPTNAKVTKAHSYDAQVTLSIEGSDGSLTPSGWSTRKEAGGDGRPFSFQPGKNLIQGVRGLRARAASLTSARRPRRRCRRRRRCRCQ